MTKIKVSDLEGTALDYAVAIALGATGFYYDTIDTCWVKLDGRDRTFSKGWTACAFNPSTNWAHGGPIIEKDRVEFRQAMSGMYASYQAGPTWFGKTHLEAAMRCFVASNLGNEVDVPEELK